MSVISCILQKFAMQKQVFSSSEGKMVPYESLSNADKQKILDTKSGYIGPKYLQQIQDNIAKLTDQGMSELNASQKVHADLSEDMQLRVIKAHNTSEAIQGSIQDLNNAMAKEGSVIATLKQFFNPSAGHQRRYGSPENTNSIHTSIEAAKNMAGGKLSPVVDQLPPSLLTGKPMWASEREMAKAVWGESTDGQFSKGAGAIKDFFEFMNKDMQTHGLVADTTDDWLKGVHGFGKKIRQNEKGYDAVMSDLSQNSKFDWSTLQKKNPGLFDTADQQSGFLKELKKHYISEGAYQLKGDVRASDLRFSTPEDWADFNRYYGRGSLLQVLNGALEDYSRRVGTARVTGGNSDAWAKALIEHVGEISPSEAKGAQSILSRGVAAKQVTWEGDIDGLALQWGDNLKHQMTLNHIGASSTAALLHHVAASGFANARFGLPGSKIGAEGFGNMMSMIVNKGGMKDYFEGLAQAGINATHVTQILGRSIDQEYGNPFTRTLHVAANAVANTVGFPHAITASRAASSKIVQQEIASFAASGKPIADAPEWGRIFGFTDGDMAQLREHALVNNTDMGPNVNELNLLNAWQAGDAASSAATKVHAAMDGVGITFAPHGNARFHDQLNRMRDSGTLGRITAGVIRPFTGFLTAMYTDVLSPMFRAPTTGGVLAATGATLGSLYLMNSALIQIQRMLKGQVPFTADNPDYHLQTLSRMMVGPLGSMIGGLSSPKTGGDGWLEKNIPSATLFTQGSKLINDEVGALGKGKTNNKRMDDWVTFANNFNPFHSIPLVGLLQQRAMMDSLEKEINPTEANKKFSNQIKAQKKMHSDYFWAPGQTSPNRG